MKRYNAGGVDNYTEAEHGFWVKAHEAEAEISKIKRELENKKTELAVYREHLSKAQKIIRGIDKHERDKV